MIRRRTGDPDDETLSLLYVSRPFQNEPTMTTSYRVLKDRNRPQISTERREPRMYPKNVSPTRRDDRRRNYDWDGKEVER